MNERIQELVKQAGFFPTELTQVGPSVEKFAKLIVQECIDIIAPYTVRMSRPGEEYLHPIQEIRKNFGVDE